MSKMAMGYFQAVGVAAAGQGCCADEEVLQAPRAPISIAWLNPLLDGSCEDVPADA